MGGASMAGDDFVHLIITDARGARTRSLHLSGARLALVGLHARARILAGCCVALSLGFVKGAREGWPVFGALVKLVAKDEFDERDKFMRANLDAMAKRVGEMQARMVQLESLGERVMGLAGLPASEVPKADGRGGALVGARNLSLEELQATLDDLESGWPAI